LAPVERLLQPGVVLSLLANAVIRVGKGYWWSGHLWQIIAFSLMLVHMLKLFHSFWQYWCCAMNLLYRQLYSMTC